MIFKTKFSFKKFVKEFNRCEFRVDEVKFREMVARVFYNELSTCNLITTASIIYSLGFPKKRLMETDRWRVVEAMATPYFCFSGDPAIGESEMHRLHAVVREFCDGDWTFSTFRKFQREDVVRSDPFPFADDNDEDGKVYEFMEIIRGPFHSYRNVYGIHKGKTDAMECFVRKYNQENKHGIYQVIRYGDLYDEGWVLVE